MNTSQRISVATETPVDFLSVATKILLKITYEDDAGTRVEGGSRSVEVRYGIALQAPDKTIDTTDLAGGTDTLTVADTKWSEFDTHASARVIRLTALLAGAADAPGATFYRLSIFDADLAS